MWRPTNREFNYSDPEVADTCVSVTEHTVPEANRYGMREGYTPSMMEVAALQRQIFDRGEVHTGAEQRAFSLTPEAGKVYLAHEEGMFGGDVTLGGYAYLAERDQTPHVLRVRELEVGETGDTSHNRLIGACLLQSVLLGDDGNHEYIRVDTREMLIETRSSDFFINAGMEVRAGIPEHYDEIDGWGTPGSYMIGNVIDVHARLRDYNYESGPELPQPES